MADGPREGDTLRILVSTDNHLGYAEKDPVRGDDSFRSFREILQLAQRERVDLLLLGGDLFHENKPSRRTMYETMKLLRTYCMGDGAVNFQVVSDQSINFPNFGVVNFEDPNFNVELPIFSIHGNHDDPAREGGGDATQSLAALDLLSAANLVNYFGKSDKVDAVEVFPVLMTKGSTRVAIYGLGNMRDERLNRMFAQQKVVFRRPSENADDWFSIFVVHQNRDDKGRGNKNCVPESVIPDFIDLVVWGHEHECEIDVQESVKGDFFITQPGSSVATSLVEGEAKPKHVAVLEVFAQSFRMSNRELHTVRPFKMGEVILSEIEELDPNDPDVSDRISEYLESRVVELLQEAELEQNEKLRERDLGHEQRQQESPFPLPPTNEDAERAKQLVLIRLRVEHTGFPVLVNQRFGARFVGRVANPNDLLLFYRRKRDRVNALDKKGTAELEKALLSRAVRPTPLASVTIEDILSKQLSAPERKLILLPETQLGIALEKFTLKNNPSAIQEFVDNVLDETQRELSSKSEAKSAQDILSVVGKKKDETDAFHALQKEEDDAEEKFTLTSPLGKKTLPSTFQASRRTIADDVSEKPHPGRFGTPRAKKKPVKKPARQSVFSDLEDEDSDFGAAPSTSRKRKAVSSPRRPPARSAATTAKKKAQQASNAYLSDDGDIVSATADDDGDEDYNMEDDEEEESSMTPRPAVKSRGRASAATKSTRSTKSPPKRKRLRKSNAHDDDEEDDDFESTSSKRRTAASTTKRLTPSQSQASDVLDLCSESEHEVEVPKKRTSRAKKPQQHKIDHLFKKQQRKVEDDHVESDDEFMRLTGKPGKLEATQSEMQSESQISQIQGGSSTRRKLPLSMVAASQSQSQGMANKGAASAARKGWGRSRR
ncbi:Double-strand break repair protein mre11a [Phytophthora boehmeriae]|uniref:Double-strand break repair protein mre11a n=1 Tax=Phytophthora boehmeriae TaxID=109152 RepID=A0A8T1X677_9STRA|nr:Double-strand break repair protein mre11a [Phytophthora boehmeriae]